MKAPYCTLAYKKEKLLKVDAVLAIIGEKGIDVSKIAKSIKASEMVDSESANKETHTTNKLENLKNESIRK